jgi:hypothetical protein
MKRMLATLGVLAVLPAGAVLADDDCRVSPEQMQPREAVAQLASDYGWTVTSMEVDEGCYEIHVTDAGGNTIEARIDPATLDVTKAELEELAGETPAPAAPATAPAT